MGTRVFWNEMRLHSTVKVLNATEGFLFKCLNLLCEFHLSFKEAAAAARALLSTNPLINFGRIGGLKFISKWKMTCGNSLRFGDFIYLILDSLKDLEILAKGKS